MQTRLLTDDEFRACSSGKMRNVIVELDSAIDIWPYVDALDLDALRLPNLNDVEYVYRDKGEQFDQVLIGTGRFNTLLAIVVDLRAARVVGHHLLDLNALYRVGGGHLKNVD
jgi:hypothetical protein